MILLYRSLAESLKEDNGSSPRLQIWSFELDQWILWLESPNIWPQHEFDKQKVLWLSLCQLMFLRERTPIQTPTLSRIWKSYVVVFVQQIYTFVGDIMQLF